jgi:signal transduction histidine kinase/CheY-like chemotaxis protein
MTEPPPRTSRLRILHLEDDLTDSELVRETLETGGVQCELRRVDTEPEFRRMLESGGFDLVLADKQLPSFDGLSALRLASELQPRVPFLFVSGTLDEETAIEALKLGAIDYVFKTKINRLLPAVKRALREAKERAARAAAETALRRSELYLVEAQQLSRTGSFGVDLRTREIRWSAESFHIFGLDPGSTPSPALILERTVPEDRQKVEQVIAEMWERKGFDFEHRIQLPDGSIKHLRVVARLLEGENELVGAVTDVTEARRAEAERRKTQEALRAVEAELAHATRVMTMGEMAASIAHEVNQPLSAILLNGKACLRWLAARPPDLAEAGAAVQRMVDDAVRAGEVIRRIRDLTRKTTLSERGAVDLNEIVDQVLLIVRGELQLGRVIVRAQLGQNLPRVLGDRVQLQQLLLNLFINAKDAMSSITDRSRELFVTSAASGSGQVLVSVRDSGIGLDPSSRRRLFDAFYTTKPAGMGMGLSICRSIVQSHGGKLWVEEGQGPGATFLFTLPALGSEARSEPGVGAPAASSDR